MGLVGGPAAAIGVPAALAGGARTAHRAAAPANNAPPGPTPAQIRAAVAKARRSTHLWATVNACSTRSHPHLIGIRAQMPALGFPARLYMQFRVDYWDAAHHRYRPVAGGAAHYLDRLGVVSFGYEQGGYSVAFPGYHGRLRGTVTFSWRQGSKLLLQLTRHTSAGHPDADHAVPPHHSVTSCRLP